MVNGFMAIWIQIADGRKLIVNNKFGACIDEKGNFINTEYPFVNEVIPETIGQYTGLTDKNGKKIFEGDIVQNGENEEFYWHFRKGVVKFGEGTFDSGIYRYTGFYFEESDGTIDHNTLYKVEDVWYQVKVIGNVFDNPELLEKENV